MSSAARSFALLLLISAQSPMSAAVVTNGYVRIETSKDVALSIAFDPRGEGKYGAAPVWLGPWGATHGGEFTSDANKVRVRGARYRNLAIATGGFEGPFNGAEGPTAAGTLGQSFQVAPGQGLLHSAWAYLTGQGRENTAITLTLRRDGPQGSILIQQRVSPVPENRHVSLELAEPVGPGKFYLEIGQKQGPVMWWEMRTDVYRDGTAFVDGQPTPDRDRCFGFKLADEGLVDWSVEPRGSTLHCTFQVQSQACKTYRPALALSFPWQKEGFDTSDPRITPYRQIVTDSGYFLPVEAFKRLSWDWALDRPSQEALCHGNQGFDLQLVHRRPQFAARMESERIHLLLGNGVRIGVLPARGAMPDYFPRFFCSDSALNERLTRFLWTFQNCHTSTPCTLGFDAAKLCWVGGPVHDQFQRVLLYFTHRVDPDGYIWSRGNSRGWNGGNDIGLYDGNAAWILACWHMYCWTGDRALLDAALPAVRKATGFLLETLQGRSGLLTIANPDHNGVPRTSRASNYFDVLPTGYRDAYINAFWPPALQAAADLERAAGNPARAAELESLIPLARRRFHETFWDEAKGRFIGWIDAEGTRHDCGMTYVNTIAATYDLADAGQVARMFHWMTDEPTASGQPDTFSRWLFAPRSNTIHCQEQRNRYPYEEWCEDGGAILWTAYYEIMARVRYLGADDAWRRFREILDRYALPDHLVGGNPLYRGEINNHSGARGSVGLWGDFPESGLTPCAFLYAFLGVRADATGLYLRPRLPAALSFAGVDGLRYRGRVLKITVWKDRIEVRSDGGVQTLRYATGEEVRLPDAP